MDVNGRGALERGALSLRPQHFHKATCFTSDQLTRMVGVLHPFPWGVRRIEIDIDALRERGCLRVQRCEVIFPDGLIFRYPEAAS